MIRQDINKKWPKRNGLYYIDHNGIEVQYPSITNILNIFDKGFLLTWACKKCASIALDNPTLTEDEVYALHRQRDVIAAGTRGKGVHNLAPKILEGDSVPIQFEEKYGDYLHGLKKFIKDYQPEQIFNERVVVSHTLGIAGCCDWGLKILDQKWLLDIKTSSGIYRTHKLQLSFYNRGLEEEGDVYDQKKILHLPGNGGYNLIDADEDVSILTHMKAVYNWKKGE